MRVVDALSKLELAINDMHEAAEDGADLDLMYGRFYSIYDAWQELLKARRDAPETDPTVLLREAIVFLHHTQMVGEPYRAFTDGLKGRMFTPATLAQLANKAIEGHQHPVVMGEDIVL